MKDQEVGHQFTTEKSKTILNIEVTIAATHTMEEVEEILTAEEEMILDIHEAHLQLISRIG